MKSVCIYLIMLTILTNPIFGQNKPLTPARSQTKHISNQTVKEAKTVKLLPDLVIQDLVFTDENSNKIIDADENSTISMKVVNKGKGIAEGVIFKASVQKPVNDMDFTPQIPIGNMTPGQSYDIKILVQTGIALNSGLASFRFEAMESKGFDAFPLELTIATHRFEEPKVQVVDAIFSTDEGGKIVLNYPINLKILIQNIGDGEAKDVKAEFLFLRESCVMLDNQSQFDIGTLKPGQAVEIEFPFTATRRYTSDRIPLKVDLTEKYRTYSVDTMVSVSLNQDLQARREVVIEGIRTRTGEITIASLVADVDRNIPVDSLKNLKKYALVIGNEDYKSKQRGINSESDVVFARRDAGIFREYLINTLGFISENVFMIQDATAAEMFRQIDLLMKLAQRTDSAEILFYYAGHGFPDEVTQIPYLIPVDVSGTNLAAAVKLSDLYNKLENSNASKITIILDACFSGGGRSNELIASRGIRIKPKLDVPSENTIIFSASTGEQSALPYTQKQHGIFTYYLLKKLQESKGNLTYGQLADYLQAQVSLQSLKINQKEQDPQIIYGANNSENWVNRMIK